MKNIFHILILIGIFTLMISCDANISSQKTKSLKEKKVLLQPLGNIDLEFVKGVKKAVENYYGLQVEIATPHSIPEWSKNTAVAKETGLQLPLRYRADSLLHYLSEAIPEKYDMILGVTDQDITCTRRDQNGKITEPIWLNADWGIFGLGDYPGNVSVISLFRIQHPSNPSISQKRLSSVAKHELGHNLGLDHCLNRCFMHEVDLSNAIASLDAKSDSLCRQCRNLIENPEAD